MPKFDLPDTMNSGPVIKVIGVGGGGGNAISHMVKAGIDGVEFICADTDNQNLRARRVDSVIQFSETITAGLGAGMCPEKGAASAEEVEERIAESIKGANMLFLAAGLGGGTGTGAAPVVARIAKELGILTVAVVTKPFGFEGGNRMKLAEEGREDLLRFVDSMITIPNDKLPQVLGNDFPMLDAFAAGNEILHNAVQGISDLITKSGLINVDFADVRTVMSEMGTAMMGGGVSSAAGTRAREAAEQAIASPLLEDIDLSGAKGILVNVTSGPNITMGEFQEVGEIVRGIAAPDANIIAGTVIDPEMGDEFRVTVVATGIGGVQAAQRAPLQAVQTNAVAEEAQQAQAMQATGTDGGGVATPTLRQPRNVRVTVPEGVNGYDDQYFDAPAFLRRMND